jgi:hypothetical protein
MIVTATGRWGGSSSLCLRGWLPAVLLLASCGNQTPPSPRPSDVPGNDGGTRPEAAVADGSPGTDAAATGEGAEPCEQRACNAGVPDLCCPSSCSAATDVDCPGCGNRRMEAGELCDPPDSCPTSCPQIACEKQRLKSAGTCAAVCVSAGLQESCADGDECCPPGCTAANDRDCTASCGNGQVEPGELCDPLASCPTTCPARGCTLLGLQGAGTCLARCVEMGQQSACASGDGCCPAGCNAGNDNDCAIRCDNGVVEGMETCDPLASCPARCPAQGCRLRRLLNGGTCNAVCVDDGIETTCRAGDGCCPVGCNNLTDGDCPVLCGNGVLESGETCDPIARCREQERACVSDQATIRMRAGDSGTCTFRCAVTPRPCQNGDGFCPAMCTRATDNDCLAAPGDPCKLASECSTNRCLDNRCCLESCAVCQSCTGAGGTCVNITKGQPDLEPPNACAGGSVCDGTGTCLPPSCGLEVRPTVLAFAATTLGNSAPAQTVTVINRCNVDLAQPAVASSSAEFPVVSNTCMGPLPPGRACQVGVAFRPSQIGPRSGVLRVNIPGGPGISVEMTGQGLPLIIR